MLEIAKKPRMLISTLLVIIFIISAIVGCKFTGAGTNESLSLKEKIEAGLFDPNPLVRRAWEMIQQDIRSNEETSRELFGDEGTTFTDAEITKLELTNSFDDLMKSAVIEVYELNYRMRSKDMSKIMLAGGMQIENGWLLEKSSMGSPYLVAKNIGGEQTYIGTIYLHGEGQGVLAATLEIMGKLEKEDNASLRGEYFDFAIKYRLDYVPFFSEGNAPRNGAEYLYYAFAINLANWGEDKGTMTRDYVDTVIRDRFEVEDISHTSLTNRWDYDGVKYTAVPTSINDKPIYVLKNFDETVENGRTVYAVTMDYCVTEEYPLNAEQRQEIRTDIVAGDYSALTAVRTESFRYYMNETTGEPVFLSHSASRPLSDYIKTTVRMNYRHIGWQSYTMDQETIGFVAEAIIGALPETLDQTATEIDNESIIRDYWEQGLLLPAILRSMMHYPRLLGAGLLRRACL